jgi:hypothetical protein
MNTEQQKLDFKDVTTGDKELISSYTMPSSRRNCDLSFSNICSWRFLYDTKFTVADGFLLIKIWIEGKPVYMMPVGIGDLSKVIRRLELDAKQEGEKLRLLGVCENQTEELEHYFNGRFLLTANRDYFDYIYLRTDLATLAGKKLQSKRNHVNKFRRLYPDYEYAPLTKELIPECIQLEIEWCQVHNCEQEEGTGTERRAIWYALEHFEALGLSGGLLRVNGQIVAFTFGMPINHNTFGVHVEKADTRIEGAYAMINQEFAMHIPEQYIYVNREEDLGVEGLRRAKLSYQPDTLLEKFEAQLL